MKSRFILFRRAGVFYSEDTTTGKQHSLRTKDEAEALTLLHSKNEAHRQPVLNLQIARTYLTATDPEVANRTWQTAMDELTKTKSDTTRHRHVTAMKDKAFDIIRNLPILETRSAHFLKVLELGTVSTNVYLRRIHNFALDMNWLPWSILPKRQWPKVKFKEKRAITLEEHQRIIAAEVNPERKTLYQLCWHLGASQGDIAALRGEDVDWTNNTVGFTRKKSGVPVLVHLGADALNVFKDLPAEGVLFPYLSRVRAGDRATEFGQRCRQLGITGITLHSYRYAWAERAKTCGYSKVPWANAEKAAKEITKPKKDDEEGIIKEAVKEMKAKLGSRHPCQFLAEEKAKVGKSPTTNWARKIYWPRDVLRDEFLAIAKAQQKNFPQLAEKSEWLLYGDSQSKEKNGETFHVFFKSTEARNPGVLGLRWPRFDNRGPALDSLQSVDEQGRPLHVVRKNKEAFTKAQWELALINFRVIDRSTGNLVRPDNKSLTRLREIWESGKRKKKKEPGNDADESETIKISEPVLKRWAKDFVVQYQLVDGQQPLTPQTGAGRARYSSPTLERIIAGEQFNPPQPLLRRKNENSEQALNRYMTDIKHPLVRHRLTLFQKLLQKLVSRFGEPDMIVLEAVRSLALGKDKKREHIQRIHDNREEREGIRKELSKDGFSSSKNSILRYRLFKEAKGRCPFCLCPFCLQQVVFKEAEIEHIVPRSRVDCNEFYNLTVAHENCNKKKDNRTPWEAFGQTADWEALRKNAEECFGLGSMKYKLFTNPDAQDLVEEKSDLQHTAYIARVIRQAALIQLGWLGEDGRDPTGLKDPQKTAWKFQVTNGQLTSRLRKAWGLNQILHPFPSKDEWDAMTPEEQEKKKAEVQEKNRGDLRHHALDAMVIATTLPWLAHRTFGATDEFGRHGWWTQDEKHRSRAANPLFQKDGEMHDVVKKEIENVTVRHHVSRSNHQQAYATTLYAKKAKDTYVAREVFTSLTPKNLGSIWPETFASYCEAAWRRYSDESQDIEGELKRTKNCVPESFTRKLCFSHFQKWRQDDCPEFYWPKEIKTPIRNVRLISVKDDTAVVPFSPGTHAFVKRTGFKEVQIFLAEDKKSFVPVFIPYWKGDKLVSEKPIKQNTKPVAIIRRGMVVETKKPFSTGQPAGKYRILSTRQTQLTLLPHHVANSKEAIASYGLGKIGLQPVWSDFIRVLGHELPHHPPVKPQPESPH